MRMLFSFRMAVLPDKGNLLALFLSWLILMGGLVAPAHTATFTVSKLADTNDGVCDADCSLREAIVAANGTNSGDIIIFGPNVLGTINLANSLPNLNSNLTIEGPGVAMLTVSGNNAVPIFYVFSATFHISDLTIANGQGANGPNGYFGSGGPGGSGGIDMASGTLYLTRCALTSNTGGRGGWGADGLMASQHNPPSDGGNGGAGGGGAINLRGGTLYLDSCALSYNAGGNAGGGGAGGDGSGFGDGGFNGKGGVGGAGGIHQDGGTLYLSNCSLAYNIGGGGGDGGGGSSNRESGNGGAGGGGGLSMGRGTSFLRNTTIARNNGGRGGSGYEAPPYSGAGGSGGAGGLDCGVASVPPQVANTIVAMNDPGAGGGGGVNGSAGAADVGGVASSHGYNLIGESNVSTGFTSVGDQTGTTITPLDANLGPLQNNGGPTKTLAILPGSPALDKGNSFGVLTDGRGQTRPYDDPALVNASGGDGSDIGAFERQTPQVAINNPLAVNEGDSGSAVHTNFAVTLSVPYDQDVTVHYQTAPGTATENVDYTGRSGTLTFTPGQTTKTVTVNFIGDTTVEPNENFFVNLSAPTNATISTAKGTGTIIDDDTMPGVSINDVTVKEGHTGTKDATFTLSLNRPFGKTVSINAVPTNGTAKAPGDYTGGGKTVTFDPDVTSASFTVPIVGDTTDEYDETFFVLLSSPVNCTISRGRGIGTITDNDAAPLVSVSDTIDKEFNGGTTRATVHINLSAPSGKVVKVNLYTANRPADTANGVFPATAKVDYVPLASTSPITVAISAGTTVGIVHLTINGDTLDEQNESFLTKITAPQNANMDTSHASAVCTILDDDAAPSLTINDVSISEGNSGTKALNFTVTLSAASGQTVMVNYATADGIARSTSDYVAKSGSLSFAPGGVLTKTISVVINGDTSIENDETLYVLLFAAANASISRARGVGTIKNDDPSG